MGYYHAAGPKEEGKAAPVEVRMHRNNQHRLDGRE